MNAVKYLLRSVGLRKEAASSVTWQVWHRLLERPAVQWLREDLGRNAEVWRVADEKVAALEEELKRAAAPFEETISLLRTAPGVGMITAATFGPSLPGLDSKMC